LRTSSGVGGLLPMSALRVAVSFISTGDGGHRVDYVCNNDARVLASYPIHVGSHKQTIASRGRGHYSGYVPIHTMPGHRIDYCEYGNNAMNCCFAAWRSGPVGGIPGRFIGYPARRESRPKFSREFLRCERPDAKRSPMSRAPVHIQCAFISYSIRNA
jgi:hypothetical protein